MFAFGGLRFGETTALLRSDVLYGGRVRRALGPTRRRAVVVSEPTTNAGHRTVTLPTAVAAVLEEHPEKHVAASPDALLFSISSGGHLARSNWNATFRRAADAIGLPAARPHEVRHTGATLAAATGATTKELMRRLGHSSSAAAILYQHAADDRDADVVKSMAEIPGSPRRWS